MLCSFCLETCPGTTPGVRDELLRDFVQKCYKKGDSDGNKASVKYKGLFLYLTNQRYHFCQARFEALIT